jgi:hypothetical protein
MSRYKKYEVSDHCSYAKRYTISERIETVQLNTKTDCNHIDVRDIDQLIMPMLY